ncbi:M4 family metallopeptidase [Mesorhizobium huakuii]|uniref:M4 family metallopeptidase n=1 Tax=Mesorhizobium huakuii TaxID=28104 RepID=UPI0024E139FF|nr:M4 family metallopeptidase [Mesorhizobium huakuii]
MEKTAALDSEIRKLREQARKVTRVGLSNAPIGLAAQLPGPPNVVVYDCHHTQTLPGAPVVNPGSSGDPTAKAAFTVTTDLVRFYSQIFNRNSIDGAGMTLISSIHYGSKYNNAFWNGTQMTYGDGDGQIFVDFTRGNDVVGHENTHGVTQYTLQLVYANEPGGLNESLSDVFGSMFRQWQASQAVNQADWLIGKDIMGPAATAKGYICLRDMANPAAPHCLAPQPTHYTQYQPGMDPHYSSGIPNLAFYSAAMAIGGNSWAKAGQIWYKAMTGYGPSPNLKMGAFADRTRKVAGQLYAGNAAVINAVDQAWKKVGL